MAADTLCVCPMATWLWVCRSVIIIMHGVAADTLCVCPAYVMLLPLATLDRMYAV